MRIITGRYKGRRLTTVNDKSVRPATDRVKTTIFNVLQNRLDLRDIRVLDLFAGSGNLGFEALSRGAAHVVFVDENDGALDSIERNADALGCLDECEIIGLDALSFLKRRSEPFQLIFADPPYAYPEVVDLPKIIVTGGLLDKGGFLIIEHEKRAIFPEDPLYHIILQKDFGMTRVSFFTHSQPAS